LVSKIADIETLICPICQNDISHKLLEKWQLDEEDLGRLEQFLAQKSLIQMLEVGELTSKYLKPEALGTEIQVRESLKELAEKGNELLGKHRELADELVKASEEKKIKLTKEALEKQDQLVKAKEEDKTTLTKEALEKQEKLIREYQSGIEKVHEKYTALEKKRVDELESMRTDLQQIQQKIVGVGIGEVRQVIVIEDLKAACPTDEFSDEKAKKRGADIVAKVKENGHEAGTIVISVKDVEDWSSSFIEQIKENLKEEQTEWGMLVTKVFPNTALNEKAYLDDNGILLVKTEYSPGAYIGLRHALIHWNRARKWLKSEEDKLHLQEHIVKVLKEWIR